MSVAWPNSLGSAAEDTDFWLCLFQHRHCFALWWKGYKEGRKVDNNSTMMF